MRFALLMLIPLALFSCDAESSRKLKQKVGSLSHDTTQKAKDFLTSSKEPTEEKPTQERKSTTSASPTSQTRPNNMQQALQQLEGQRKAQEKQFSEQVPTTDSKPKSSNNSKPSGSNSSKPSSYQGFPGFEK